MIKTLKRNELRWALPYEFKQENPSINFDDLALSIVNSEDRQFKINGHVIISKNETDLHYIYVFSNVRIKHFFINSIKLYYIDYASNYDLYYEPRNKKISEHERKNYFITFEMILNGSRTLEDVKILNERYEETQNKRNERMKATERKDLIKETRKHLASELLSKKLSKYQTIKNSDGRLYYIVDGVLFHEWDLLQKKHKGLTIAKRFGNLITAN